MTGRTSAESGRIQSIVVLLALIGVGYASWIVVRPFLGVLTWAVVMTVLFFPAHRRIEAQIGPGVMAALVSTFLVIVTLVLPTAAIITATVAEIRDLSTGAPTSIAAWVSPTNPMTGGAVRMIERFIPLDQVRDPAFIQSTLEQWGTGLAAGSLRVVGGALSALVQMALVVFTIFFLFKDARLIRTNVYDLIPIENKRLAALLVRTREVIRASVYGTLLLAVIQGALGGLAFLVLRLPSPFLWGVVMTLASIVPLLGSFVVWVPAVIYLLATGAIWKAVALAAWGLVVIGMADNVLRPVLVGNRTRMHELLVFFGVLGGLQAFGALGVVIGPVIFAVMMSLIEALREVGAPRALREPTSPVT